MEGLETTHHRWTFADCEVDLEARELRRAGETVELEPRAFDLLALLLARHGQVVSRDEMLEAVWPGRVVSDSAFNQAILKVRRAVGDDGNAQRIVRTISRRGYRFVADVHAVERDKDANGTQAAGPPMAAPRRWFRVGAVTIVLGVVLSFGVYRVATEPEPRYAVLPITLDSDLPEYQWVELGLMALIDESLSKQAIDTVNPGAVLSVLEQTGAGDASDAERAAALTGSYGHVRVIAASADRDRAGWRLDYSVYQGGERLSAREVRAGAPAELAAALSHELLSTPRSLAAPDTSYADESHARGLAANLEGDSRAAAEYFLVALREQPKRPWTRYELALAQRTLGQTETARATLSELVEVAASIGDAKLETGAHSALGILEWRGGRLDAAEAHLRQGLALAEEHDGKTAGLTLNLGILASSRGEFEQANELYRRALTRYRAEEDRGGAAKVYNSLGVLAWKQGRYAESGRMHQQALEIRRELGLRGEAATSANNLGTVVALQGKWSEAEGFYSEARDLHRELGNKGHFARSTSNLASVRMWQGRYTEADALATEAMTVATDADYRPALREACTTRLEIALRQSDVAAATRRLSECALLDSDPPPVHVAQAFQRMQLASLRGETVDLAALLDDSRTRANAETRARTALVASRIADLQRDDTSRETYLRDALDAAREAGHPGLKARSAAELGRLWLQRQRVDDVEPLLADAALWPEYAPGIMLSGLYAEARGDLARARSEMLRAKEFAGDAWTPEFIQVLRRVETSLRTSTP